MTIMPNIFEAIRTNNIEDLKAIIESGSFDPNEIYTSECGIAGTALHLAARLGNFEATKMLLETEKFDVNLVDNEGMTPFKWVVFAYFIAESKEEISVRDIVIEIFLSKDTGLIREDEDYKNTSITKRNVGDKMLLKETKIVEIVHEEHSSELHPGALDPNVPDQ